ncbi:hypothetical protein [Streptomyces smaragdinus]|uniref:hypothetical protein n=1 Tax=Streptomyces smaragdinus TaxID=2585196 RepID=UPI0012952CF8|nr:hypothetical protein [Streptomyces smaragdinus]
MGWFVAAVLSLGGVGWEAVDCVAALGAGPAGTVRLDHCASPDGETRVCRGVFRSDGGVRGGRVRLESRSRTGSTIAVTRTLLGQYVQRSGISAANTGLGAVVFATCGVLFVVFGRRELRAVPRP